MVPSRRSGHGQFPRLRQLAFIGLAIILCFFVVKKIEPIIYKWRIRTAVATYGTEETVWRVNGLIVRTEDIVSAPAGGRVTLLVGEGRRVRAGDPVVELVNDTSAEQYSAILDDLNRHLNQARAEYEANVAALTRKQRELDESLTLARRALSQALASGNEAETQKALEHRDGVMAELKNIEEQLAALRSEFEQTETRLLTDRENKLALRPNATMVVSAPKPGIVSFAMDGYESFVPGASATVVREQTRPVERRVQDGAHVNVGEPLFRLVDMTAPVEIVISSRQGIPMNSGTRVELVFGHDPNQRFTGRLLESIDRGREWVGRVRLDYASQSLVHRREDVLQLIAHRAEGIVVPARAIYDSDGRTGVFVMLGDQPVFREVTVLGGNDRNAVIDAPRGVPVGAPVVLNPHIVAKRVGSR